MGMLKISDKAGDSEKTGGVPKGVGCLPRVLEALRSRPSTTYTFCDGAEL